MRVELILIITAISLAALVSTIRWRLLSIADRVITLLLWLTLFQEGTSRYMIIAHANNMPTYHVYSPIELLLISTYYHLSHSRDYIRFVTVIIGISGLIISILITLFLQNIYTPNTYFLLIEAVFIIVLSLLSLYKLVLAEESTPFRMVHFWVSLCLFMYWSITLAGFGMLNVLSDPSQPISKAVTAVTQTANLLFYSALLIIFIRYKKLIPSSA